MSPHPRSHAPRWDKATPGAAAGPQTVGAQLEPQVLEQFYSVLSHDRVNMKAIRDSLSKLSESILRYHAYSKPAVDVTTHPPLSLFHAHTCLTTTTIAC